MTQLIFGCVAINYYVIVFYANDKLNSYHGTWWMMNVHDRLIFVELLFLLLFHNDCSLLSHAWKVCNCCCCCCLRLRSLFMYNAVWTCTFVVLFVWRVKWFDKFVCYRERIFVLLISVCASVCVCVLLVTELTRRFEIVFRTIWFYGCRFGLLLLCFIDIRQRYSSSSYSFFIIFFLFCH